MSGVPKDIYCYMAKAFFSNALNFFGSVSDPQEWETTIKKISCLFSLLYSNQASLDQAALERRWCKRVNRVCMWFNTFIYLQHTHVCDLIHLYTCSARICMFMWEPWMRQPPWMGMFCSHRFAAPFIEGARAG